MKDTILANTQPDAETIASLKAEIVSQRETIERLREENTNLLQTVGQDTKRIKELQNELEAVTREGEATQVMEDNRELFEALAKAEEKEKVPFSDIYSGYVEKEKK